MDELMHYGIKGQRWGFRRFQNPDGTLTAEGKIRYSETQNGRSVTTSTKSQTSQPARKSVSEMSNEELQREITRIKLEREYRSLNPKQVSTGRKVVNHIGSKILLPVAEDVSKAVLKAVIQKKISEATGLKLKDEKKKKKEQSGG